VTKITELPEVSVLADDDFITAVDVSDMSESPTGKNVKIQKQNLLGAGAVSKVEIARITDPAGGDFDFTAISGEFDRLIIEGELRGTVAATGESVFLTFNGDTVDTNYHYQTEGYNGGVSQEAEASNRRIGAVAAASSPTGSYHSVKIVIEGYAGTNLKRATSVFSGSRTAGTAETGRSTLVHDTLTSPITQLTVSTDNHPTDTLTGTLILYGEKTL
jgi:hypothetical protein